MTIRIKLVRRPNAKLLSAIHTACFHKGWSAAYIAESLKVEGTVTLMAGSDGFAFLRLSAGEEARILTLAVKPEARRQGRGKALLHALLTEASRRGAQTVMLNVNEHNTAAIGLYAANGFLPVGKIPAHYSNPDGTRSDALSLRYLLEKSS